MLYEEIGQTPYQYTQLDQNEEDGEEHNLLVEARNSFMLLIVCINLLAYVPESIMVRTIADASYFRD